MSTIEQLRRKADQHWELAGLARLDRDFADEARHMGLARELERRIREMKVFDKADVADEARLAERVAELEKALEPFAREADEWSSEFDDSERIAGETNLTVGHLRAARKLLRGNGNGE